jgi:hypothetical protein
MNREEDDMYAAPPDLPTRVFARVPGAHLLEGPSFDRGGHLWVTDVDSGTVQVADLDVPGLALYSHLDRMP